MNSPLQQLTKLIVSLDSTFEISSLNTMTIAIQSLDDLAQSNSKAVAQNINNFIQILYLAINNPTSCLILQKAHLFDFIVRIVEKYPKLAKGKSMRTQKVLKAALDIVCQISAQVSDEWMNPPDGFKAQDEQDVDSQTISQIMSSVDSLAIAIGFKHIATNFQPLFIEHMQKQDDWRYSYSALVLASQIAVQGASIEALATYVQFAFTFTEHPNPKVRHAALQLLGQYSQDLGSEFQEVYYSSLLPVTVKLLNDPIPRVVAHTFACLTNCFQKCKQLWKLQNVLGQYLNPIIHYIKIGSTWTKEAALSTISSIATTEDAFGPNLPSVFQLAAEIIQGCSGKDQFKQIRNQSFELVGILLASQKKQLVQPYLNDYVTLLFNNREVIDVTYFLQSWSRLCTVYQQFTDINPIYPILLQNVKTVFAQFMEEDDCVQSLACLKNTLNSFKSKAASFSPQTAALSKQIFKTAENTVIQKQAILLLVGTYRATKPNDPQSLAFWFNQAQQAYKYFVDLIQQRLDCPDGLIQQLPYLLDAVQQLINSLGSCLSGANIVSLVIQQFSFVYEFHGIYANTSVLNENQQDEEINSDQQGYEGSKIIIASLEEGLDNLTSIIQSLLKLSAQPTTKLQILELYQKNIQDYIAKQPVFVLFAVSLTVDIVSNFSYIQIKHQYPSIIQLLSGFLQNPSPRIRNASVFGFKLIFSKINPHDLADGQVSNLLQCLAQSFHTQFPEDPSNENHSFYVKHCKDNVISSLGCLLKYFGSAYPVILNQQIYNFWLSNLPLSTDKKQGDDQQLVLMEFLSNSPGLLIKEPKDLLKICQIYAKFVMKRGDKEYKQIVAKTKDSLLMMKQWSLFKDSSDYLWESLSDDHKKTLMRLMAN